MTTTATTFGSVKLSSDPHLTVALDRSETDRRTVTLALTRTYPDSPVLYHVTELDAFGRLTSAVSYFSYDFSTPGGAANAAVAEYDRRSRAIQTA